MKKFRDKNKIGKLGKPEKTGKSKTVPGMAFSPKDIVERRVRNLMPDIQKQSFYEMEEFGGEINPLRKKGIDLTDLDDIKNNIKKVNTVLHEVKESRKKEAQKKKDEELRETIRKEEREKLELPKGKGGVPPTENSEKPA